jgi:hypothetical protein
VILDRLVPLDNRVPREPPVPGVFLDRRVSKVRSVIRVSWDLKATAVISVQQDR